MEIPECIREIIADRPFFIDNIGKSDSQVICFEDMVLKIEKQQEESDTEHRMMRWLFDKLPVPEILCSAQENGRNYLLMSRMDGEMGCSEWLLKHQELLTECLAEGLKMLWEVDVCNCPYRNTLENKLRLAEFRVVNNLCDMEDVEPETYGEQGFQNPEELLQWLKDHKPQEDLVFSHGDFCLPNIFIKAQRVCGFIDLGRSGIADRYQDLALCYRSLRDNLKGDYTGKVYGGAREAEGLFEKLGIVPDWDKIRYYMLLDELF